MEIGKVFDVVSLFSTAQRDFLIRNNGEKVKVDSLKGKIIAIYFISLDVESPEFDPREIKEINRMIKEVYDDLSPQNNFEVVLVAQVFAHDDKKLFHKFFSRMPWLAIPQADKKSRRKLCRKLRPEWFPVCPILDDKGKILKQCAITDFEDYGAEGYPFTPERIIEVQDDDKLARASMSLKRLLTTPTRDFLIRNNFEKVPVSHLEGKVVAFYIYNDESVIIDEKILELYEQLRRRQKQFEIVFINSRDTEDEKSYMEAFKRMPWLGLPSNDRSYLKLNRIFGSDPGELVIFRPGEKYPDSYGRDVIDWFGIEAYPFTRKRVTEITVARLRSLTLKSILFSGRCKYIQGNGGQKIKAHHLVNKTILLLFTARSCAMSYRLVPRLIKWYNKTKKTVKEDLEIIHIPYDYDPAKECYYGTMPWLQFPYDAKYNQNMFRKTLDLYNCAPPKIIAFGADGKILTRKVHTKFLYGESKFEYPFTDVDFFSEVGYQVACQRFWPEPRDEYKSRAEMEIDKCPPNDIM